MGKTKTERSKERRSAGRERGPVVALELRCLLQPTLKPMAGDDGPARAARKRAPR